MRLVNRSSQVGFEINVLGEKIDDGKELKNSLKEMIIAKESSDFKNLSQEEQKDILRGMLATLQEKVKSFVTVSAE